MKYHYTSLLIWEMDKSHAFLWSVQTSNHLSAEEDWEEPSEGLLGATECCILSTLCG